MPVYMAYPEDNVYEHLSSSLMFGKELKVDLVTDPTIKDKFTSYFPNDDW